MHKLHLTAEEIKERLEVIPAILEEKIPEIEEKIPVVVEEKIPVIKEVIKEEIVDQSYNAESANAQSGKAVAEAIAGISQPEVDQSYNAESLNAQSGTAVADAIKESLASLDIDVPEVDDTLSIAGASADSLVVGNKLKEIYQRFDNLQNFESGLDSTDDGLGNVTVQFLYTPLSVTDDDLGNVSITL